MIRALILLLALAAAPAAAQDGTVSEAQSAENLDAVLGNQDVAPEGGEGMSFPIEGSEGLAIPEDLRLTPETQEALQAAIRAQYGYYARQLDHRRDVFEWQYQSSRAIFVVVVIIVLTGLYFSWMQFRRDQARPGEREAPTTTFEASGTGIKVSSPVLGVIILAISLVFFYLYLVHVYPINEIF